MKDLMIAIQSGQLETVDVILSQDIDINARLPDGTTPLIEAVVNLEPKIVALILSKGANVELLYNESSALIFAAITGCLETCNLLLQAGANADAQGKNGWTPLLRAASRNHWEMVKVLIHAGVNSEALSPTKNTAIIYAAEASNLEVVELLITKKANINVQDERGCSPLAIASVNGCLPVVQALIKAGVNIESVDANGATALMEAAANDQLLVFRFLLQKHVNLLHRNNDGVNATMNAAYFGNIDILKEIFTLEPTQANVTATNGCTALMLAAKNNHLTAVQTLIDHGANIEAIAHDGRTTALIVGKNHPLIVEALILAGANYTQEWLIEQPLQSQLLISKIEHLKTIHSFAKGHISQKVYTSAVGFNADLSRLITEYAIPSIEDNSGDFLISLENHNRILLCDTRIDNEKDGKVSSKDIALLTSIKNGNEKAVLDAIDNGANVNIRDEQGSALEHAVKCGNDRIVLALFIGVVAPAREWLDRQEISFQLRMSQAQHHRALIFSAKIHKTPLPREGVVDNCKFLRKIRQHNQEVLRTANEAVGIKRKHSLIS